MYEGSTGAQHGPGERGPGDDTLLESAGPDRYTFRSGWGQDTITGDGDPLLFHDSDDVCFG